MAELWWAFQSERLLRVNHIDSWYDTKKYFCVIFETSNFVSNMVQKFIYSNETKIPQIKANESLAFTANKKVTNDH